MSVRTDFTCDYCGAEMIRNDGWARIRVEGCGIDVDTGEPMQLDETHHYHAGREGSCYRKAYDALLLAEDAGPTLETIPTISSQAVAARRRKHRKGDE